MLSCTSARWSGVRILSRVQLRKAFAAGKLTKFLKVWNKGWEKLFISSANLQSRHALLSAAHQSNLQGTMFTKICTQDLSWQVVCGISMRGDSGFKLSHVCTTQPQRQSLKAPNLIYCRFLAACRHRLMIWGRSSSFRGSRTRAAELGTRIPPVQKSHIDNF